MPGPTLRPEEAEWWEWFVKTWGRRRAYLASCANCKHCHYDREVGGFCWLHGIDLGWVLEGVCRAWTPREGESR